MSHPPTKRARKDTANDGVDVTRNPSPAVRQRASDLVHALDSESVTNMLISIAAQEPKWMYALEDQVERRAKAEGEIIVDFDYLSKSAWKTLNVTYSKMRDSEAWSHSGDATSDIEKYFEIIKHECSKNASFGTKESLLETLRKIGKSICLSQGIIPRQIRKEGAVDHALVETMLDIVENLTNQDKKRLLPWCEDKLEELYKLGKEYGILENIYDVIDLLELDNEDEYEDGNGDGEETGEDDGSGSSEDDEDQ